MGHYSFPEFIVICVMTLLYAIPIAAAIWAIRTLISIRNGQKAIQSSLETIERAIQDNSSR